MSDVPMPQGLSQEAVAEWLHDLTRDPFSHVPSSTLPAWHWKVSPHPERARAVLALVAQERSRAIADATAQVEAKVREACARLCESFKEHLWSGAAAPGTHAGSVATLLAGAIRRIPLPAPATGDAAAVREACAIVPGSPAHVALWDAINAYSVACGGHPTRGGGARMDAVVGVEDAIRALPLPATTAVEEALPTRGDVGRPEATRDPVFLLRWRPKKVGPHRERWHVEGVWFTREEAERFAEAHAYRWGSDSHGPCWHVYCVPADGELARLLKTVTKRAAEAAATHAAKGGNCG